MAKSFVLRKFLMVAMILTFVFVTAACGGNTNKPANEEPKTNTGENTPKDDPKPDDTPKTDSGEKVKLKVAAWVDPNSGFKKIGDAFTAANPNIEVEIVNIADAAMIDTLTQAVAANDPIDLFWSNTFMAPVLQGFAEDLTPYIDSDPDFKNYEFSPGRLEQFQYKGSQYALSRGNDSFLIYYNKDLMNKYGLTPPSNEWTVQDMIDMAKKATNPAEKNWGFAPTPFWLNFFATVLPVANGHAAHTVMMNEDYTKFLGDDPAILDDLQSVADWITKDGTMLNGKGMQENGVEGDLWANGQALFMVHVSPLIPGWKDALKFKWDVAPYPAGTAKQVGMVFDNPMFLSKAGKHKEAAWKFMKFWTASVEGQKILIDIGGTFPNTPNQELVDYFKNNEVYKGLNADALAHASKIGEIHGIIPMIGGSEVDGFVGGWSMSKGFEEGVTAHDYFPSGTESLNKKLQELQDKYK
ncbi:ABC transporter substrate-binding protein [Paenibacillus spongiae]|uniref:Sugar ABC transporter substrate-binding protein n=1 Tax=Paenibacillus spongiae TaxID=2909671 RepID=A0ABY5S3T8_9BACL|nr:sugar ABC transporter substrate-binding protein [Paenibacillus spongiae]UVI27522.1 sugar ABC transporter substrate-binding protein [Paenibacillus spongiae]